MEQRAQRIAYTQKTEAFNRWRFEVGGWKDRRLEGEKVRR
jgi:hypothetical protein